MEDIIHYDWTFQWTLSTYSLILYFLLHKSLLYISHLPNQTITVEMCHNSYSSKWKQKYHTIYNLLNFLHIVFKKYLKLDLSKFWTSPWQKSASIFTIQKFLQINDCCTEVFTKGRNQEFRNLKFKQKMLQVFYK